MRIYQRKGVWYIDYSFNGRRVRKKVGTFKKMAQLALKEIELKIAKGEFLGIVEPERVIFDKLCAEYLDFSKANKQKTSYDRDVISARNLGKCFNGKVISEITARGLEQYKNRRKDEVKPATVNRELSYIKHMFTKAVQWSYLTENPLRSVVKFREPPGRTRHLNGKEIQRLLYCCADLLRPIVITALNTGMRKSELLNLRWSDIDMVERVITVRASKNNESRHIPISDRLYSLLLKLKGNSSNDDHVFIRSDGKPILNIQHAFEGTRKRARLGDFRFHDLRHTFATQLRLNGADLGVIQTLLGHKSLAMTMRYAHFADRKLKDAVDMLRISGYDDAEVGTNLAQSASENKQVPAKRCNT